MKRSSGILMPVFSLPSPYGIGTLGKSAYEFIDFLEKAGQSWWQILPVGPTSYGDSPYQSPSAFAGNPYFIDLDMLVADKLLKQDEIDVSGLSEDPGFIDYEKQYECRMPLLEKAALRGWKRDREKVLRFTAENPWVEDYSLFMAVKKQFNMLSWLEWPDEAIRMRDEKALRSYRRKLGADIRFYTYLQYLFFQQWDALKEYAHSKGVQIIGDLPIYVALDSADVWAESENFQLDDENFPVEVAGVPPDYFSADGQLWGNPLYDYSYMAKDGFGWWIRRIDRTGRLYDVIRIDHFRGFASYWAVPYGEETARNGRWVKGPGMSLISVLKGWFPHLRFIAEDLGLPTPEVAELLSESGFPGMKVLEFAFDYREESAYLPHRYDHNCICYTGTHDNDTVLGWKKNADQKEVRKARRYLGLNSSEGFVWGMIRGGMSSTADVFIAQIQDYLELGENARINVPGTLGENWKWRMLPGQLSEKLADRLYKITALYGRL